MLSPKSNIYVYKFHSWRNIYPSAENPDLMRVWPVCICKTKHHTDKEFDPKASPQPLITGCFLREVLLLCWTGSITIRAKGPTGCPMHLPDFLLRLSYAAASVLPRRDWIICQARKGPDAEISNALSEHIRIHLHILASIAIQTITTGHF